MGDFITGLAHVNLNVPSKEHLVPAGEFWSDVLGMKEIPVPKMQQGSLRWFEMPSGQQVHVSVTSVDQGPTHFDKTNHPCFQLKSPEALVELQRRIFEHHRKSGSKAAAYAADEPGGANSGAKGAEYPTRFFVRDYVGNRLEFSL